MNLGVQCMGRPFLWLFWVIFVLYRLMHAVVCRVLRIETKTHTALVRSSPASPTQAKKENEILRVATDYSLPVHLL